MNGFVHLHVHSEYSLLDGACKIKNLIENTKLKGFKSVAITDHGSMYGCIDFYKQAVKEGIKPIIGCEMYVAPRSYKDKTKQLDLQNNHLVLLCKNNEGYNNLINLISIAWIDGFYNKPRVDDELLKKYSKGLIALSGCLAGKIPQELLKNDYDSAKETALKYNEIFGKGNFYIEIQDHGMSEQKRILPMLANISEETGIPMVATNDCHYINKEDANMHKTLLCIQTNHTLDEENGMEFESEEFYYKTEDEMRTLFSKYKNSCDNTIKIADMCNVSFEFGKIKLPTFYVPNNKSHFEYFKEQCYKGMNKLYGKNPSKNIIERLEYELNIINTMGYVDYYLIVNDFVSYAKKNNIPVGPGRGSGAGSLAAFCVGITGIDPIKYNLLFERFLNPERISMPDFDIDFCYERRQEVIDYVIEKYGEDHVTQIITFGTMAARAAIRDVGRVMAVPYATVDSIAKLIPTELGINIERALKISTELREKYENDNTTKDIIDMAKRVEGMPRQASTHAAGVVITDKPVNCYVPLAKNNDAIVTQYTMSTLEELGLLKMDFLGLRTLTVLSDAEKLVQKNNNKFLLNKINMEDENVFKMLSKGSTEGVFQFESAGMTRVLMQLGPKNIEDLIAVISLYRPGPMESIPQYIQNRHNLSKITYKHPLLEPILSVTYGCIVYQEQVMQIFRSLGGYSLGRADIVRRAMSKKKHDIMEKERKIFIEGLLDKDGNIEVEGSIRRGVEKRVAEEIFSQMESFASYAFNKSHAAAYAFIAYQTAYMKYNYPKEFMAALLTSVLDNSNKIKLYINECNNMGIKILPPSVNESENGFTVSNNNIRFGLLAIQNLGRGVIKQLIEERENNGKFISFYDFCKRMYKKDLNRRAFESLIKCGALDYLGSNRRQMLTIYEQALDKLDKQDRDNIEGQINLFEQVNKNQEDIIMPEVKEFPKNEILNMEKESIGMFLSGHPVEEYEEFIKNNNLIKIGEIIKNQEDNTGLNSINNEINTLCIINKVKLKTTKSNSTMAFLTVEDITGSIETIIFPKTLSENSHNIKEGNIIIIKGKLDNREDKDIKIISEKIFMPSEYNNNKLKKQKNTKKHGLYIKVKNRTCCEYEKAQNLISIFEGLTPVYFYFTDIGKLMLAPKSMWVDINDVLYKELENQLGEKNIALKNG